MRAIGLIAIIVATSASAQTQTNCYVNGQWVNCTTTAPPQQQSWTTLLPQPRANDSSDDLGQMLRARAQRKADAYARVGDLIAQGDCVGAKRLAAFYSNRELIAKTDAACQ